MWLPAGCVGVWEQTFAADDLGIEVQGARLPVLRRRCDNGGRRRRGSRLLDRVRSGRFRGSTTKLGLGLVLGMRHGGAAEYE